MMVVGMMALDMMAVATMALELVYVFGQDGITIDGFSIRLSIMIFTQVLIRPLTSRFFISEYHVSDALFPCCCITCIWSLPL